MTSVLRSLGILLFFLHLVSGINVLPPCFSPTPLQCGVGSCLFENGVSNKCVCSINNVICQFLCPVANTGQRCKGHACILPANQPTTMMGQCQCPQGATGPACDNVAAPTVFCSNHGRCNPFGTPGVGGFNTNFCCDNQDGRCHCDNAGCNANPDLLTSRCGCEPNLWDNGGCACQDIFPLLPVDHSDFQCYCDRGWVGWNCEYVCPRPWPLFCRWRADISRCVVNVNDPLAQVNCPTYTTEFACNNPVVTTQCDPQYGSCATRLYEPCSGHGECRADFTKAFGEAIPQTAYCDCDDGWGGGACDTPCPIGLGGAVCSNRGRCLAGGGKPCCERIVTACNPPQPPNVVCYLPVCAQGGITSSDPTRPYCPGRGVMGASCVCANEFWGPACQFTCPKGTSDTAECSAHGACEAPVGLEPRHVCKCDNDWAGDTCSVNCPAGQTSPCSNAGTCTAGVGAHGGFGCACTAGHLGKFCQATCPTNPSTSAICSNAGTCVLEFGAAVCRCNTGRHGSACEFACPLGLGGLQCSGANGGCSTPPNAPPFCQCALGKTGRACEMDCTTACHSAGLLTSTSCSWDLARNRTTCECKPDWHGLRCETDCEQHCGANVGCEANACGFAVCECSARGNRVKGTGHCMCLDGFGGPDCSLELDIRDEGNCSSGQPLGEAVGYEDPDVLCIKVANRSCANVQQCAPQLLFCAGNRCTVEKCPNPDGSCTAPLQPTCSGGLCTYQVCPSTPRVACSSEEVFISQPGCKLGKVLSPPLEQFCVPDPIWGPVSNAQQFNDDIPRWMSRINDQMSGISPPSNRPAPDWMEAVVGNNRTLSLTLADALCERACYRSTSGPLDEDRSTRFQQTFQFETPVESSCIDPQITCACQACITAQQVWTNLASTPTQRSTAKTACLAKQTNQTNMCACAKCLVAQLICEHPDSTPTECNDARAACTPTQASCDRGIAACDKAQLDFSVCVNNEVIHATNDAPYKRSGSGACCCTVGLLKPYALGFGTGRTCLGCGFCGSRYPAGYEGHPEGSVLNGCTGSSNETELDSGSGSCVAIPPIQLESGRIIGKWTGVVACKMGWFGNGCRESIDSLFPSCTANGGCTGVHLCTLTNSTSAVRGLAYTPDFFGRPVQWEDTTVLTRYYPHGRCVGMNHNTDIPFTNPLNPLRTQHLGLDDTYGFSSTCNPNDIVDYSYCLRDIPGLLVCHSGWTGELCAQQVV